MSVLKICQLFGMSRKRYYKWCKRYEEEGFEWLSERRRRCKGYGPVVLSWYLRKHGAAALSPNGVYGVLKRAGLIRRRRKPGRLPRAAPVREPGELVQMDLKEPPRAAEGLRSVKYYQFTAIDKATTGLVERTHRTDDEEFYKLDRSFKNLQERRAAFKRYPRRFDIEHPNVAHDFDLSL
jgi:hypothetical protein